VYYGAFAPVGIGLRFNLFDEAGAFINSQYRIPVTYETSNYHFFHAIGLYGVIGKKKEEPVKVVEIPQAEPPKDTDGDGITDDKDKCPTTPGVAKYDGCPVPDTDKDGINDDNDKCPTVPGVARYQGCPIPDTDKDGINDEEDKCPSVPGVARYQGCPVPDSDNDGVNDEEDKCPQLAGTKENQGCPEIKQEVKEKVAFAANNILFATGSSKLLASSNKGLNDVVKIMQENADMKLSIDGHTDNTGTAEKNQTLSQARADAVKNYFVGKGIDASRMTATGHGQDLPIADNKTAAGRQKNRRVELKLGY
jgi:outer membrane protein OmpA-like peptidoglycan-associated protein